ncbi:DNA polymerase III subunit epsilon [Shewanella psychropiezotolerans]|uniref:DNA polymerase III subunit epsilon n=1 Tax=Shewanella psychropiezotolerans TaxID=2593655 RepID=A0ABX5WT57_9GAMM|nr:MULTISPECIES: DNA polymerase III subunit epsilon [Shewanella]MPY25034.1 DNA polymerase III subunit epsilon [Shewanella sp. YLB-07]QDO82285.1 DNA polymerase III subunit epsilon [Shewanella psychropiezotolerans]
MNKLNAEERKARDNERFSQRVDERRVKGEDVVAYALANKKAFKFLTKSEKHSLKERQAVLLEEAKIKAQEAMKLRDEQELEKVEAAFPEEEDTTNSHS